MEGAKGSAKPVSSRISEKPGTRSKKQLEVLKGRSRRFRKGNRAKVKIQAKK